jgi:ribokinase
MTAARVCVVGSANVDLTFATDRLPGPGETRAVRDFRTGCGGKGANQAVMAARAGAAVAFVGRVGTDPFGERLRAALRAEGVDTAHLAADPARPTGLAGILLDDSGENRILLVPGANAALTPSDVRDAAAAVRAAAVVVGQVEVPVEATLEAFRLARAAGAWTLLNPAPAAALPDELLRLTDWCVPNETEAAQLTGHDAATPAGAEAAADALRRRGPSAVVVTLGARGCLVSGEGGAFHVPAPAVPAVDTTGAGDAFVGALAALLAAGVPLRDAAARSAGAASLSVTRPGAQSSYPTAAEVDAFLARGTPA